MRLVNKPFKDALRDLPEKKLSWAADRRILKMLRKRIHELEGPQRSWWSLMRPLVAAPMALVLLVTATSAYGVFSPKVVRGDVLYTAKMTAENWWYPESGTSEERVAYHLWLSQRRYDEVNEILRRLGKPPISFIPRANAQELNDDELSPLDQALLETLQSATQHVDYAFIITDEIREVERVNEVKEQIRETLGKQKIFLEKAKPVLQEVKIRRKRVSRQRERILQKREQIEAERRVFEEARLAEESVLQADADAVSDPVEEGIEVASDVAVEALVSDPEGAAFSVPLPESSTPSLARSTPPVEFEVPVIPEIEDIEDLMLDRLAFQESLLEEIDRELDEAAEKGATEVVLSTGTEVVDLVEEEDLAVETIFQEALEVHVAAEEKVLEEEIKELEALEEEGVQEVEPSEVLPVETSEETDEKTSEEVESESLPLEETPVETDPVEEPVEPEVIPEPVEVEEELPVPVEPEVAPEPEPQPLPEPEAELVEEVETLPEEELPIEVPVESDKEPSEEPPVPEEDPVDSSIPEDGEDKDPVSEDEASEISEDKPAEVEPERPQRDDVPIRPKVLQELREDLIKVKSQTDVKPKVQRLQELKQKKEQLQKIDQKLRQKATQMKQREQQIKQEIRSRVEAEASIIQQRRSNRQNSR